MPFGRVEKVRSCFCTNRPCGFYDSPLKSLTLVVCTNPLLADDERWAEHGVPPPPPHAPLGRPDPTETPQKVRNGQLPLPAGLGAGVASSGQPLRQPWQSSASNPLPTPSLSHLHCPPLKSRLHFHQISRRRAGNRRLKQGNYLRRLGDLSTSKKLIEL